MSSIYTPFLSVYTLSAQDQSIYVTAHYCETFFFFLLQEVTVRSLLWIVSNPQLVAQLPSREYADIKQHVKD